MIKEGAKANSKEILITVKVENGTNKTWKHPKFQVQSLDDAGNLIVAENLSDYDLVIGKNSTVVSTLTLKTIPDKPVTSRKVALTDLDSDLY